jgi:hypothetical protein
MRQCRTVPVAHAERRACAVEMKKKKTVMDENSRGRAAKKKGGEAEARAAHQLVRANKGRDHDAPVLAASCTIQDDLGGTGNAEGSRRARGVGRTITTNIHQRTSISSGKSRKPNDVAHRAALISLGDTTPSLSSSTSDSTALTNWWSKIKREDSAEWEGKGQCKAARLTTSAAPYASSVRWRWVVDVCWLELLKE